MFFAVLATLMIFVTPAKAAEEYSGQVYIEDNEDLLTQEEEAEKPMTKEDILALADTVSRKRK